jgi:quercetin dioxygenase-like cupin family protein
MENAKNPPAITVPQDGPAVSVAGGTYRILVGGKQTGGEFATIDMLIPPGGGPGPHAHAGFHECFYVVDGEVEVRSEAGTYTATKGTFIHIPKGGIVHAFKNKTQQLAHLLCTVVPAGLDEFFLELGTPVAPGDFLPARPMDEASLKKLLPVFEKYGQKIYPPDYLG